MKVKNILIAQPEPANSPYSEIISKYGVKIDFFPFFRIEPLPAKDFRSQRINILDYTAIVFTSKAAIDAFFKLAEELRISIPETMKYFCATEAIALYLQKHIVYRKRKIFFGNGPLSSIIDAIGSKHKGEKFLLALTENCSADLNKLFEKAKLDFSSAVFVRPVNTDISNLDLSGYQLIVFYSPGDIKSLLSTYPDYKQDENTMFATYGPATAKELSNAGLKSIITAPTPEMPSIAKALDIYLGNNK